MDRCLSLIGKVRKKLRRLGKAFKFRLLNSMCTLD